MSKNRRWTCRYLGYSPCPLNPGAPMSDRLLPDDLRFEEVATFLALYRRARDARPLQYPTFRDLFHGLGAHTTTLGHLTRLLDALFPTDTGGGIPTQQGERLKLLFTEQPGRGLCPAPLADRLYDQLERLEGFWAGLRATARAVATNQRGDRVVRVGAPHTITLRLLPYVCSDPSAVFCGLRGPRLDIVTGDTERELLPQLHLGTLDCIVGYGLPSGLSVYTDPDDDKVNFADLGSPFRLVLIYHPEDHEHLFGTGDEATGAPRKGTRPKGDRGTARTIDPHSINLRRLTLVAVPSWRQCEAVQDLIDRARRLGRLKEVQTDDEALALVRAGCGIAIVPEVFKDRRVIRYAELAPRSNVFTRRFGVYYSRRHELLPDACRFAEFLRAYMKLYNQRRSELANPRVPKDKHKEDPRTFPPANDDGSSGFAESVFAHLALPASASDDEWKARYPHGTFPYDTPKGE